MGARERLFCTCEQQASELVSGFWVADCTVATRLPTSRPMTITAFLLPLFAQRSWQCTHFAAEGLLAARPKQHAQIKCIHQPNSWQGISVTSHARITTLFRTWHRQLQTAWMCEELDQVGDTSTPPLTPARKHFRSKDQAHCCFFRFVFARLWQI